MFCAQLRDVIERYHSRDIRRERLEQLNQEQRENLAALKEAKESIEMEMQVAKEKLQQLISNRQVYQEVEMKDAGD